MEGDELHMKTAAFYRKKSQTLSAHARKHVSILTFSNLHVLFKFPALFSNSDTLQLWLGAR